MVSKGQEVTLSMSRLLGKLHLNGWDE